MNLVQFKASRSGEVGVQSQYLDGELHLVDNALAGAVAAAEKLQVLDAVVRADTVDVVDGFSRKEFSSERFFHDVTVLKSVSGRAAIDTRNNNSDVAMSRSAFGRFLSQMFTLVAKSAKQRATFRAAQTLLSIYGAARLALNGHRLLALNAIDLPFIGGKATAFPAAFGGAVQRFFAPLFDMRAQVTGFHGERAAANAAGKVDRLNLCSGTSVDGFMSSFARQCTKSLPSMGWLDAKNLAALFAVLINWHLSFSMPGQFGIDSTEACVSK